MIFLICLQAFLIAPVRQSKSRQQAVDEGFGQSRNAKGERWILGVKKGFLYKFYICKTDQKQINQQVE